MAQTTYEYEVQLKRNYKEIQALISNLDGKYHRAKAEIESFNIYYEFNKLQLLVNQFQIGDSGDKAIAIVAQLRLMIKDISEPFTIIQKYEQAVKTRNELAQQMDKVG